MIILQEMNSVEFERYLSFAIKNYAHEHVKAENWNKAEAMGKATAEFEKLLPKGEKTDHNHLFTIRDEEREVGMIWFAERSAGKGYIYDIIIWEDNQGQGYGKAAMKEIESFAYTRGIYSIGLHVFGHNNTARGLYESLGYMDTDVIMKKTLTVPK